MNKNSILLIASFFLLTSCLMPQNFVAEIKVMEDETIEIHYKGQLLHVMAHSAYKEDSKPNEADDQRLRKEAFRIFNLNEFRKSVYKGKGVFDVEAVEKIKFNHDSNILTMLDASRSSKGVYTITIDDLSPEQKEMLASSNIQINGKVRILLPKHALILENNADFKPWFFSDYYVWKIKSLSDFPLIRYTLIKSGL